MGSRLVLGGCVYLVAILGTAPPSAAHPGVDAQIADLDARIAAAPEDVDLLLRRAELHRLHGELDLSRRDLDRVRRLDRSDMAVLFIRGKIELDAGRTKRAVKALDRFIAAEPGHASALTLRGEALALLGRHLRAADDYSAAIASLDRAGPKHYLGRARALVAAGPEHVDAALLGLEEGLDRLGRPITLELEALALEQSWGRHDAALARLDRLTAAANRKESWLIRRGALLESVGRTAEASSAYADALTAIEQLPPARRGTRGTERMLNEAREALERLQPEE